MCIRIATSLQRPLEYILVILLWHRRCVEIRQQCAFVIVTVLVLGTLLGAGSLQPGFVLAETRFIPSVVAAERYDTNIYFATKSQLPPGTRLDDFVTSVGGGAQLLHKSRDLEASLTAGADVNAFVYNTGVNFLTTRTEGYAILDGWVGRLAQGAQLRVDERFRYTPESPGFLTGAQGGGGGDPFLRGIQGFRANTFAGTVSINGSYPVARGLALEGRYTFGLIRVGTAQAVTNTGAVYFNTTINSYTVGPRFDLTPVDSIFLSFQQSLLSQTDSGSGVGVGVQGANANTNAQTLSAKYARVMPDWSFSFGGGVTLIEPASHAFTNGSMTITTNPERLTIVQLDLSRQAAPSFFLQAGALISNVGQVQITHLLSERLSLRGRLSYALNEGVPTTSGVQFTNITVSTGIGYKLTRTIDVGLFYDYTDFKNETPALSYTVLRNVVGFSLTGYWN